MLYVFMFPGSSRSGPYFRRGDPPLLSTLQTLLCFVLLFSKWCLAGHHHAQGSGLDEFLVYTLNEVCNQLRGSPARPQSNNPHNVRSGLGCGQQRLSKASCLNSEDKCKAGPDWGQGVAWQGCHGDRAGLAREGMLNEAIVWPKWSTPLKEWHIQTVIQAYCCGGPAECCRSTVCPRASATHDSDRAGSDNTELQQQETTLTCRNLFLKLFQNFWSLLSPLHSCEHHSASLNICCCVNSCNQLQNMLTWSCSNFQKDHFPL